jgi:ubiquinone/menaquinone biosynthesis C-methylase UbiE
MEKDFDEVAEIYDEVFKPFIRDHYLNKRAEFIKRIFTPGMRILEIGCGTGLLLDILKRAGFDVYGVDKSKEMVSISSKKIPNKIFVGDALEKLPFSEEFFDGVIFIATVHHLGGKDKFEIALVNALNILKKSGKILIWDHNPLNLYWYFLMKKVPQDTGREIILSGREILDVCNKHAIKNCKIYKKGFVPDFTNKYFFRFFIHLERIIENIPFLKFFLAHNVIVGEKNVEE